MGTGDCSKGRERTPAAGEAIHEITRINTDIGDISCDFVDRLAGSPLEGTWILETRS